MVPSLSLLYCESSVSVKENLDRGKKLNVSVIHIKVMLNLFSQFLHKHISQSTQLWKHCFTCTHLFRYLKGLLQEFAKLLLVLWLQKQGIVYWKKVHLLFQRFSCVLVYFKSQACSKSYSVFVSFYGRWYNGCQVIVSKTCKVLP